MNIQSNINSAINQIASVAGLYSIAKQKKAAEQAKKDAQARQEARKQTIQNEVNYWKNLGK